MHRTRIIGGVVVALAGIAVVTATTLGAAGLLGGAAESGASTATPSPTPTSTATPTPGRGEDADRARIGPANGSLTLRADANQTIRGVTGLQPGTPVVVRVVSNGARPFIVSKRTTVGEAGRFSEQVDLGAADPASPLRITVVHDGEVIATTTAAVDEGAPDDGATTPKTPVDFAVDQVTLRSDGPAVVAGTTTLAPGTVLVVRVRTIGGHENPFVIPTTATVTADGSFTAALDLPAQRRADLRVTVDVLEDPATDEPPAGNESDSRRANTTIAHTGQSLSLVAAANQSIRGTTDLPAGTTLTVQLVGSGAQPFALPRTVTVGSNGTFTATFDLSGIRPSDAVRLAVYHDGVLLVEVPVTVDPPKP